MLGICGSGGYVPFAASTDRRMPLIPMTEEEAMKAPPRSMMREAWEFYRTPRCMRPNAPNRIVTYSLDQCVEFDAWSFIEMISPRPLLMIVGTGADSRAHADRVLHHQPQSRDSGRGHAVIKPTVRPHA
ncbi:hypothetical protein [Streptomyces sp. NPDC048242]|uniref:hypothetical protein n=1 Tax=Streptomyces sp. NPDC048242 TaxID=3155026 RepID=UPI003416E3C1